MSDAPGMPGMGELTAAEKTARLTAHGFVVAPDGAILCGTCGRGIVWLEDAKPGDWVAIGCPSDPLVRMSTGALA